MIAVVWAKMCADSVRAVPYYMFIARGSSAIFEVPLYKCLEIYQTAKKKLSGLGHTARGPSMSCGLLNLIE